MCIAIVLSLLQPSLYTYIFEFHDVERTYRGSTLRVLNPFCFCVRLRHNQYIDRRNRLCLLLLWWPY
jgi:hypothetical protein